MVRNTDRLEVACVGAEGAGSLLMLATINMRHCLVIHRKTIDAVLIAQPGKMIM